MIDGLLSVLLKNVHDAGLCSAIVLQEIEERVGLIEQFDVVFSDSESNFDGVQVEARLIRQGHVGSSPGLSIGKDVP